MTQKIVVEVCCESLSDAKTALNAGADRIELNSALRVGGLTPSPGLTSLVCGVSNIPVIAMVRPRESGFCYSEDEFETMCVDARMQLELGASGIAFGILLADGNLDIKRCKTLISIAREFGAEAVIHRAFDFVIDWKIALEQCIKVGFDRLMTSGAESTAIKGANRIRNLINRAQGRIDVLPAAGIAIGNVLELVEETGCNQIHGSFSEIMLDPSIAFLDQPLVDLNRDAASYRAGCSITTKQLVDKVR